MAETITPNFIPGDVHKLIDQAMLQCFVNDDIHRVSINTPPRCGKSTMISKAGVLWLMATFPGVEILLIQNTQDNASKVGREIRDTIIAGYVPGLSIMKGHASVHDFRCSNGSRCCLAGVGTKIPGLTAHALLLDDMHRDFEEASIAARVDHLSLWYVSSAASRLTPFRHWSQPKIFSLSTRWHAGDIMSKIVTPSWHKIVIPAISQDGIPDSLGREPGVSYFPERFPIDYLQGIYEQTPEIIWSALYQQQPSTSSGDIFTLAMLEQAYTDDWPKHIRHGILALDPATGKGADFSSIAYVGASDKRYWVDLHWGQWTPLDMLSPLADLCEKYLPHAIVVEDNLYHGLVQHHVELELKRRGLSVRIISHHEHRKKEFRIQSNLEPLFKSDKIRILKKPKMQEYEKQMLDFPQGKHDDIPDSMSLGVETLARIIKGVANT